MDNSNVAMSQQKQSRATIADFNPIDELKDIPVNIINVGNTKNKFLSCVRDGDKVDLYNKDDGSLRQRWYLKNGGIVLAGGNAQSGKGTISIGGSNPLVSEYTPKLLFSTPLMPSIIMPYNWQPVDFSNYRISTLMSINNPSVSYLQSESSSGTTLKFKSINSGTLAQWEVKPVGDFEVISIDYVPYDGSKINSIPEKVSIRTLNNTTSTAAERSFTETIQATETARYSKTEGISITTTTSTTRPIAGPGQPDSGSTTIGTSMTHSWSFTQEVTQSTTTTRTENFKIVVPPYTKYTVTTYLNQYSMSIKYVATLKASNGQIFRVKGTWTGSQVYDMYQDLKEESTGKTVRVYGVKSK